MPAPKRPRKEKVSAVSPTGERPVSPRRSALEKRGDSAKPLESYEEPAERGSDDAKLLAREERTRADSI